MDIVRKGMSHILKVRNVNDYGSYVGCPVRHPLVCVVDYAEVSPIRHSLNNYSVYGLFLRDDADVDLDYGCGKYDSTKVRCCAWHPDKLAVKRIMANVFPLRVGLCFSTLTCCMVSRSKSV